MNSSAQTAAKLNVWLAGYESTLELMSSGVVAGNLVLSPCKSLAHFHRGYCEVFPFDGDDALQLAVQHCHIITTLVRIIESREGKRDCAPLLAHLDRLLLAHRVAVGQIRDELTTVASLSAMRKKAN